MEQPRSQNSHAIVSRASILLLLCAMALSMGCMYRGGHLKDTQELSKSAPRQHIRLALSPYTVKIENGQETYPEPTAEIPVRVPTAPGQPGLDFSQDVTVKTIAGILPEETSRAYNESGLFEIVPSDSSDAYQAEVRLTEEIPGERTKLLIAGCSVFLVPVVITEDFTLTTTFWSPDGRELGKIVKTESLSTLVHLLAFPYLAVDKLMGIEPERTLYDLNHATLVEAFNSGMFAQAQGQSPTTTSRQN